MSRTACSSLLGLLLLNVISRADHSKQMQILRDIEYARAGEQALKLDLYLPEGRAQAPLIIWVHGGAWRSGSKKDMPLGKLVSEGYAVASVDYRLSTQAKFPADRKSTRLNSSHIQKSRMPSSA